MAKRKREVVERVGAAKAWKSRKEDVATTPKQAVPTEVQARKSTETAKGHAEGQDNPKAIGGEVDRTTIQIITGSYERVLHGFITTIPQGLITGPAGTSSKDDHPQITFSDSFLFNAHASSIRCLALSPPSDSSKVILATGSTDERINLYSISTAPPPPPSKSQLQPPTLHGTSIAQNPKNKELGSLLHHSSSITALYFPTRSKLLSAAEDSTIAVTRTRDWTPLSNIKAPIPKPQGRPSGDTAAPGEVPAGINDFAVHPSMKLMVSVGKGEKCMRLWNLVTGKKAGVLNFGREILASVGEGRFGSGEGRRVVWDAEGEEYAVAFERGVAVFGIDCKLKAKIVPSPRTKVHQMYYLPVEAGANILAVSTEDGRVMLYDTASTTSSAEDAKADDISPSTLIAQLGGPAVAITGRVKDFEILPLPNTTPTAFLVVTGSSDGTVRVWSLNTDDLISSARSEKGAGFTAKQVGRLLGTYSTGTRITCMKCFIMTGKPEEAEEEDEPAEKSDSSSSEEESE